MIGLVCYVDGGRIISGITAKSQATVASATSTEQLKVGFKFSSRTALPQKQKFDEGVGKQVIDRSLSSVALLSSPPSLLSLSISLYFCPSLSSLSLHDLIELTRIDEN